MKKSIFLTMVAALAFIACEKDVWQQSLPNPPPNEDNMLKLSLQFSSGRVTGIGSAGTFCRYLDAATGAPVIRITGLIPPKGMVAMVLTNITTRGNYPLGNIDNRTQGPWADICCDNVGEQYQLKEGSAGSLTITHLTDLEIKGYVEVMLYNYSAAWFTEDGPPQVSVSGSFQGHFTDPSGSRRAGH